MFRVDCARSRLARSELEAMLAVQIVATGFSGMRFLRQSQRHMTEDYIDVYGAYAIKLLKLQNDLIHTPDRHRRVTHRRSKSAISTFTLVHKGWSASSILHRERGSTKNDNQPYAPWESGAPERCAQVWSPDPSRRELSRTGSQGKAEMSDAR